jgi:hypothetical protein
MIVSDREKSIIWWRSLYQPSDRHFICKNLFSKYEKELKLDTWKGRQYFDLTGREIEDIWRREMIEIRNNKLESILK